MMTDAQCISCFKPLNAEMLCENSACALFGAEMLDQNTVLLPTLQEERPVVRGILDEAHELVNGDRQAAYGHPRDNHACTAALWNAYLERRGAFDEHFLGLSARDVCWLNILQKCSRDAHASARDNLVDTAGFAANADMVSEVADS